MNRIYRIKTTYDAVKLSNMYTPEYSYWGVVWTTVSMYRDGSGLGPYLDERAALSCIEEDRAVQKKVSEDNHKPKYKSV